MLRRSSVAFLLSLYLNCFRYPIINISVICRLGGWFGCCLILWVSNAHRFSEKCNNKCASRQQDEEAIICTCRSAFLIRFLFIYFFFLLKYFEVNVFSCI